MSSENVDEITAWHEAGHAFVAVRLGGEIDGVSISPDRDDGPDRFGDTTIRWRTARFTPQELRRNAVLCALAGPVTEMIRRGDVFHPATVSEWALDWQLAWQAAADIRSEQERLRFLEQTTWALHDMLSQEGHWAAIGAIVDHLLAYESLEGDTVHEIVAEWTD